MKRFLVLFLATFISLSSFAQERNSAVFVDLGSTIAGVMGGGFGIGFGYEQGIADNISLLVNASYIGFTIDGGILNHDTEFLGISAGLGVRYYPLNNPVNGWFFDVSGIYSYINIKHGDEAVSNLFEMRLLTGWKFVFPSGFFLEPGLRYTIVFGDIKMPAGAASVPSVGGLGLWLGLGIAF